MRPIHDHEIHHGTRPVLAEEAPTYSRVPLRDLAESVAIPLAFTLLFVAWPLVFGAPAPWWVVVGALLYGAMGAWAVWIGERGEQASAGGPAESAVRKG